MQRGILGGTFDPPHIAHLLAGEAAYRELGLQVVTFLPAGDPWQKAGRAVSSAQDRWEMTKLAIEGVDYFEADPREVHREGPTFTIDTLATLPAEDDVTLILGADAALGLSSWHRSDEVLSRARLAVLRRPGVDAAAVEAAVGEALSWLDAPEIPVSGTMIRARVGAGGSARFLVADPVWGYIEEKGLYRS